LRMLRLIVPLMTYVVALALVWVSVEYVFEVNVGTELRSAMQSVTDAASQASVPVEAVAE